MCIFKKKSVAEKTKADRELVASNSQAVEALIVIAKDNDEIIGELKVLKEKLKFLIPSENPKVADYDKSIKNKIGDLRIALTKSDGEATKKALNILTDIKLDVADRNTKI